MNSDDFYLSLAEDSDIRREGAAFLHKLKTAGVSEAVQVIRQNAPAIGIAAGTAALAVAGQYAANRPGKSGESVQQRMADAARRNLAKRDGSFASDMSHATADAVKDVSDVLAKHPGKGALMALPAGAAAGWRLAKALR